MKINSRKKGLKETTLMPGPGESPVNMPNESPWQINVNGQRKDLTDLVKPGKLKVGDRVKFENELGTIIKYNLFGAYTIELDSGVVIRKIDQSELIKENKQFIDCKFCKGNGWHNDGSMCNHCFGYGLKLIKEVDMKAGDMASSNTSQNSNNMDSSQNNQNSNIKPKADDIKKLPTSKDNSSLNNLTRDITNGNRQDVFKNLEGNFTLNGNIDFNQLSQNIINVLLQQGIIDKNGKLLKQDKPLNPNSVNSDADNIDGIEE